MTGLVGWWPLHENSGNTAYDLSGKGNHGTLNGGVTQGVAGKGGLEACSFDGSSYISVSSNSSTDFSRGDTFSVSFWIKVASGGAGYILSERTGSNATGWSYDCGSGIQSYFEDANNNTIGVSTDKAIDDNKWHHFVGIYEGTSTEEGFKFYLDGEKVSTSVRTSGTLNGSMSETSKLGIGSYNLSGNYALAGNMCDIRIYNRVLSAQEIQTLYEWGAGDYACPPNDRTDSSAVSRWKFDGNLSDSWGNNSGTDKTSAGYSSDAIRGQAKKFSSSNNDYVNLGDRDIFQTFPLSYSVWFKLNSTGTGQALIEKGAISKAPGGGLFVQSDNSVAWNAMNPDTGYGCYQQQCSGGSVDSGEWYHAVGAWTGKNSDPLRLYLNGVEVSTAFHANSGLDSQVSLDIGKYGHASEGYLDGKIDDSRIYNRALSHSEVFQLYQWGTRGRDMRELTVNSR